MENTRQFCYFRTSQITQSLAKEFPALILSTSSLLLPWSLLEAGATHSRGSQDLYVCCFLLAPKPGLKTFFCVPSLPLGTQKSHLFPFAQQLASISFSDTVKNQLRNRHLPIHYVADTAINLWGRDLLQQWKTQINIPSVSQAGQKTGQAPN